MAYTSRPLPRSFVPGPGPGIHEPPSRRPVDGRAEPGHERHASSYRVVGIIRQQTRFPGLYLGRSCPALGRASTSHPPSTPGFLLMAGPSPAMNDMRQGRVVGMIRQQTRFSGLYLGRSCPALGRASTSHPPSVPWPPADGRAKAGHERHASSYRVVGIIRQQTRFPGCTLRSSPPPAVATAAPPPAPDAAARAPRPDRHHARAAAAS